MKKFQEGMEYECKSVENCSNDSEKCRIHNRCKNESD